MIARLDIELRKHLFFSVRSPENQANFCLICVVVPLARLERALPKKNDFESFASTDSATGAACAHGGLAAPGRGFNRTFA